VIVLYRRRDVRDQVAYVKLAGPDGEGILCNTDYCSQATVAGQGHGEYRVEYVPELVNHTYGWHVYTHGWGDPISTEGERNEAAFRWQVLMGGIVALAGAMMHTMLGRKK
jgi:hypothetical protein